MSRFVWGYLIAIGEKRRFSKTLHLCFAKGLLSRVLFREEIKFIVSGWSGFIQGDPRFPLGSGWKNSTSRPALCIPLVTPDTLELYGVLEFTKDMMDSPYTKKDVEACLNLVAAVSMSVQEDHESVITDR